MKLFDPITWETIKEHMRGRGSKMLGDLCIVLGVIACLGVNVAFGGILIISGILLHILGELKRNK